MAQTITKMELVNLVVDALYEFGLSNIENDVTTVLIDKHDYFDVEVVNTTFNAFIKAHATMAWFCVEYDGDRAHIDRQAIRAWIESFDTQIE